MRYIILLALIFLAPVVQDTTTAHFSLGTLSNINATSDQIELAQSGATTVHQEPL